MDATRLLAELQRHQDAILAHLDATVTLLGQPAELVRAELSRRRWELVRLLRSYQLFKHARLFDPLIRRSGPAAFEATALKARCVALGETFAAHVRQWSGADTAAAWRDYVGAAVAMNERLREHMVRERAEATRLLAQVAPRAA